MRFQKFLNTSLISLISLAAASENLVAYAASSIVISDRNQEKTLATTRKFDHKTVVCFRRARTEFVPGQLQEKNGKLTWTSLQSIGNNFSKAGNTKKAAQYKAAHDKFLGVCRTAWEKHLTPKTRRQNLTFRRRNSSPFVLDAEAPGTLRITIKTRPTKGRLSGSGPNFTYTPPSTFVGRDFFTYIASANGYTSKETRVNITVEDCGFSAHDVHVDLSEGQSVDMLLPAEDSCKPDLPLNITYTTPPQHGTIRDANPRIIYTPQDHSVTSDSFAFEARNDLGEVKTATVTIGFSPATSDFAGNPNLLGRYHENLSAAEVQSVLDRVAFGGTAAQRNIRSLSALVDSLVDETENPELATIFESDESSRLARSRSATASYNPRWFFGDGQVLAMTHLRYGAPFHSWMTFGFWHNHFTTNLTEWSNSGVNFFMPEHVHRLQRNSLGNFRDFLNDMLTDGSFHLYLNNFDNTVANPNENFGREFLELFTAGIEDPVTHEPNYYETDMVASTRALSGHSWGVGYQNFGAKDPGATLIAPQDFSVSDGIRDNQGNYVSYVVMRWTPIKDSAAAYYVIERAPFGTSSYSTLRTFSVTDDSLIAFDTLTGPNLGVPFNYRIRLKTAQGALGPASNVDSGYAGQPPGGEPANPATIASSYGGYTPQIDISWSAVSGAAGYQILRQSYDEGVSTGWIPLSGTLSAGTTSYSDTSALPNTVYRYRVRTVASDGTVSQPNFSDTAVFGQDYTQGYFRATTGSVTPPGRILGTKNRSDGVLVSWEPSPGASGYRIFRSARGAEVYSFLTDVSAASPEYLDTSASPGIFYSYVVRALDSDGNLSPVATAGFAPWNWNTSASQLQPLTFLTWISGSAPNAAGKIAEPGTPMSARGWSFSGQPNVTSFVDHVLYNWPATRRQIAAKLFAHFAHRHLTEQIVGPLADELLANDFEIKPVLRTILSSSAMFAPEAHNTCVASPLDAMVGFLRRTELPATTADTRYRYSARIAPTGYDVLNPPSVFGWKNCGVVRSGLVEDGSSWTLSSQTYIALGNGISNMLSDASIPHSGQYPGEGVNLLQYFVPEGASAQASVVVDRIASTLGVSLSAEQRTLLIQYLNTDDSNHTSNFNGASHLSRVTGLIRLITMHTDFLTK